VTLTANERAVGAIYKMKRRIVHTLQKFLLNPPIKLALAMGLPLPGYTLLETTGVQERKITSQRQWEMDVSVSSPG
jgi:hypothetical protein